jgi:hypothetical protein
VHICPVTTLRLSSLSRSSIEKAPIGFFRSLYPSSLRAPCAPSYADHFCKTKIGQSKVVTRTWIPLQTHCKFIKLLSSLPTVASLSHNYSVSSPALSRSGVVLFLVAILQPCLAPLRKQRLRHKVRVIDSIRLLQASCRQICSRRVWSFFW